MELKHITTTKFIADPKKGGFVRQMTDLNPVFDIRIVDKRKWLTYLTLMYDPRSEIRRNVRDYMNRKYDAAIISGSVTKLNAPTLGSTAGSQ